ncbi:cation-transporting P-type ATPase [Streptomyces fungicidicus]
MGAEACGLPAEDVVRLLRVDPGNGLTAGEAAARAAVHGPNSDDASLALEHRHGTDPPSTILYAESGYGASAWPSGLRWRPSARLPGRALFTSAVRP